MGDWQSIDIELGPYSWHVEPGDEGQLGDVLGGLSVETNYADDHPVVWTLGPMTCKFSIIVDDVFAAVSENLDIGSRVSVLALVDDMGAPIPGIRDSVRFPLVQFVGRVAELSAQPTTRGRTIVSVSAVDRLADLANVSVGAIAYPAEQTADRFERIWLEGPGNKAAGGGYPTPTGDTLWGTLAARDVGSVSSLELIQETLAEQVDHDVLAAHYIVPNPAIGGTYPTLTFDTELDEARPFTIGYIYKNPILGNYFAPQDLPGVLALGPDGWRVEVDPQIGDTCFDGDFVDLDTSYSKTKNSQVDRVYVVSELFWWIQHQVPNVPIEWRKDTQQTSPATIVDVARFALPERAAGVWGNDGLRILDSDVANIWWFCGWATTAGYQRNPVVIRNVDPAQNPSGKPWIAGMFGNATIEFTDGGWAIDLELRPSLPRPYSAYERDPTSIYNAEPYLSPKHLDWDGQELAPADAEFAGTIGAWTAGGSLPPALAADSGELRVTWQAGGVLPLIQLLRGQGFLYGREYTVSAYIRTDTADAPRARWFVPATLDPVTGASGVTFGPPAAAGTGVQLVSVTFIADFDCDYVQLWPDVVPAAAGKVWRIDHVKVNRGPVRSPDVSATATIRPVDLDPTLTCNDLRIARRPD